MDEPLDLFTERLDLMRLHFREIVVVASLPPGERLWKRTSDVWRHGTGLDEVLLEECDDPAVTR